MLRLQKYLALGLIATLATTPAGAEPSIFPTGVTIYDPARAYSSFVVFDSRDGNTHLIDMDGNEVHRWNKKGFPSEIIDPAVNGGKLGHLLVQLAGSGGHGDEFYTNPAIGELDWNGNEVWTWGKDAPGGAAQQNHDWERLANGNTLIVATKRHPVPGFKAPIVRDQAIYEITPEGKIVWTWLVSEHLSEFGFSPEGLKLIRDGFSSAGSEAGFLTINDMNTLGANKWFDGGDKRFAPDNIMIDSREGNVIAIIDKKTGHFTWRIGPYYPDNLKSPSPRPFNNTVPRPIDQIVGQHDAHVIPAGLPGAGNLLVFDNQGPAGFPQAYLGTIWGTRVLEIDPIKQEIVWQYNGESSGSAIWSFFSSFIGSARRLPNGNTLIDEGMNGRFFQVTPKGEIVWEYINPYSAQDSIGGKTVELRWAYRAQPVPYGWVPAGTPHSEKPVIPPAVNSFRVPGQ